VLVLGLAFAFLGMLSDSLYALAAGTVADRLRDSRGMARFQRWFGGGVLVGLGVAAAVVSPHRSH
jgi:threonine/homoserine/homoserine lactone efflux protein